MHPNCFQSFLSKSCLLFRTPLPRPCPRCLFIRRRSRGDGLAFVCCLEFTLRTKGTSALTAGVGVELPTLRSKDGLLTRGNCSSGPPGCCAWLRVARLLPEPPNSASKNRLIDIVTIMNDRIWQLRSKCSRKLKIFTGFAASVGQRSN